mmetsp:Transcript_12128/g.17659  ORF Transcript_12128/g.17659 Transcript_12128/m.17659 type:complete len:119 (-) Transcript_12128:340-696(-)
MDGKLETQHLELAQHVLGRKCLVGLSEEFHESVRRFTKYFDWKLKVSEEELEHCEKDLEIQDRLQAGEFTMAKMAPKISPKSYEEGTEIHKILTEMNSMDLELYKYAKGLFHRQALYA